MKCRHHLMSCGVDCVSCLIFWQGHNIDRVTSVILDCLFMYALKIIAIVDYCSWLHCTFSGLQIYTYQLFPLEEISLIDKSGHN